jgi:hypothetical protein
VRRRRNPNLGALTKAVRATGITGGAPRWSDPDRLARIRLIVVDDSLIIEVWDQEATPPVVLDTPDPEDEGGRGLLIVAGLSKQWNYYRLAEGGKWVVNVRITHCCLVSSGAGRAEGPGNRTRATWVGHQHRGTRGYPGLQAGEETPLHLPGNVGGVR